MRSTRQHTRTAGPGSQTRPWVGALAVAASLLAAGGGCAGRSLLYEGRGDLAVEPIEVRLVRIAGDGLRPEGPIRLTNDEGGVAFLNDTPDRAVEIVFPAHALDHLRCSYTRGFETGPDGASTRTVRPVSPGSMASICLHTPGTIPFEVRGAGPEPLRGRFEVKAKEAKP